MGEVSRLLALRIDALVAELFPAAKRVGHEWCVGSLAGEPGNSLAIHSGGAKSGVWADFSAGQKGDPLELVALALFGGDRRRALQWALAWLGLGDNTPSPARPRPVAARQTRREPESTAYQNSMRILDECKPPGGGPVEYYLAGRGLCFADNDYDRVLWYHPSCPFGTERHPAMVALMTDPVTNRPTGVHRTAVAADGGGKANIASPKMMLGNAGVIRLTPDEDVSDGLGICEGIETGLAIIQRAGWKPIWATGSAGNIAKFPVLPGIECLTIFADHDPPNKATGKQPGLEAARQCAARWHAAGREVVIQQPPLGMDWDNALKVAA